MSTPHERDAHLDTWLRRTADGSTAAATAACLDAETAAAWLDGGLSDQALARAQAHAANCGRCQTLLRTLSEVETAAAQDAHEVAGARVQPWWTGWRSWLLPVGAAATLVFAVVVWNRTPAPSTATVAKDASVPATSSAAATQSAATDAPQANAISGALTSANEAPTAAASAPAPQPAARVAPEAARGAEERADRVQLRARAVEPPAPAPPPAEAMADSAAAAKTASPTNALVAATPAPAPAAAPAVAPRAAVAGALAEQAVVVTELAAPGQPARWRLVGGRLEERRGTAWQGVPGIGGPWTAGSAPAGSVCWVVGPGGVVARTADGTTWNRLNVPRTDDLVAVRATSATAATVTTRTGDTLSTTDAGATWR